MYDELIAGRVYFGGADDAASAVEDKGIPQSIQAGEKVYFHCGGGNGRASVMAVATLMELELADSLEEAENMVKEARPSANIRPKMQEALEKLYK